MQHKRLLLSQTTAWGKELALRCRCPAAARGRQPSFMLNCEIFLLFQLIASGFQVGAWCLLLCYPRAVPTSLPTGLRRVFTSTDRKSGTPESQHTYRCFPLKDRLAHLGLAFAAFCLLFPFTNILIQCVFPDLWVLEVPATH